MREEPQQLMQRYQLLERIDSGGMAEVFRAIASSSVGGLKRQVAIKRILPELTQNKKFVVMFLDEARLSLNLQHANIVQITDIGKADASTTGPGASYFLVMEYVEGVNLRSILDMQQQQNKLLSVAEALYIGMEICKALAYAHELVDPETHQPLHIVHRDVSPPNILLSKNGEIKLTDFGLAKAVSQLEGTEPGVVKGKFSYLSPEAAMGQPVDHRTDIFAIGLVLYEMLTNRRLFDAPTDYQTLEQVRLVHVPPVQAQNPAVDGELERMIHTLLARHPNERYQHAKDVMEAFAHYLAQRSCTVTSRDIEHLVARCMLWKAGRSHHPHLAQLATTLVEGEVSRFTAGSGFTLEPVSTAPSLSLERSVPGSQEPLVDPRLWYTENNPPPSSQISSSGAQPVASTPPPIPSPQRVFLWALAIMVVLTLVSSGLVLWVLRTQWLPWMCQSLSMGCSLLPNP